MKHREPHSSERGQAAAIMVLSLTMLFGVIGFSVDLGQGYYRKQAAKAAADAAALAAAAWATSNTPACGTTILCSTNSCATLTTAGNASYVGCQYAKTNGFTDGSNNQTVTMSANSGSPTSSAPGASTSYWITATVSEKEPQLFLGVFGSAMATVNAQSTAGLVSSGTATSPCIYILSPTATDAFDAGNGVTINTTSCGIYVNSNASTAMLVTGGATVNSSIIDVVGGVTKNNGGTTSTSPQTGVAAVTNPFAGLSTPTVSGSCLSGNFTSWQASPYTPQPGNYCSGFSLGNGMGAVMASGTYVISGGPFSIQSGPLTASGPVLIVLSGSSAYVNIANGTTVNLSAPSTGTYQGILFFQDPTVASPSASTIAGGASMTLAGSMYFPKALVNINNGTNSQTGALVAGEVNFEGGATFKAGTQAQTGISTSGGYTPYLLQ